ncbi:MAG: DUF4349 domain-containing protein [Pseudomonadota bacterium]
MPSLHDPALDERFDELAAQIRGARPRAGAELRLRVREAAARDLPEPRRPRRLVPILAFAAVLAIGAVAAVVATRPGTGRDERAAGTASSEAAAPLRQAAPAGAARSDAEALRAAALPPSQTRLQLYRAQMTLRVGSIAELNRATRRAIRVARSLGGFVVAADLRTPERADGTSRLVLRVPTTKAQAAFERFAGLGTLVSQRVRLDDLQAGVNRRNERIDELRTQIAALERRAAAGEDVEAALRALRAELRRQQDAVAATARRGSLATFRLTLTTADAVVAPEPDGAIEHAVREAWGLLDDVVAGAVYAVVLGGPVVLLAVALWLLERRRRRRSDERLLAQH